MNILAIETSCDETAISIVNFKNKNSFEVLSDTVISQIEIHKEYGGVYPAVAKREHLKNIYPLLIASLKTSKLLKENSEKKELSKKQERKLEKILEKDSENLPNILELFSKYQKPDINAVAVTYGPGLEIALWSGFNIARALSLIWEIDVIPTNHMEGHIYSSLIFHGARLREKEFEIKKPEYPSINLLISGGHTELVLAKSESIYKFIGGTLDDAVGEAYDKSARLLGYDYPGGPQISKLAESFSASPTSTKKISLPRPMLNSGDFSFSFSGLKTAVLYTVKDKQRESQKLNEDFKKELSAEFENAVSEVLVKKTTKALEKYTAKSLIIAGGVSANNRLRTDFKNLENKIENLKVYLPEKKYTGDNALMIAVAGYYNYQNKNYPKNIEKVDGNLKLK